MNDDELAAGVLSHLYSFSENLHYPQSLFWKLEPHPAAVRREGRGPSSIHDMRLLAKKCRNNQIVIKKASSNIHKCMYTFPQYKANIC